MPAFLPFEQKLAAHWPTDRWRDVGVLVAVSGGPDSVSLLRGMDRLRGQGAGSLAVAHFNHGLRGDRALADQQFVERLCGSLGVECVVGQAEAPATRVSGEGLEAALRAARYEFLARTAEQSGARYVATGHTADDQAETILHHILRGTGLRGLGGMRRIRPLSPAVTLVRPLLEIARDEVLDYLAALEQPYQQDETNRDRSLTRNRIRHELLPLLARDYSPSIVESLVRLGGLAGDAQQVIDTLAQSLLESSLVECDAKHVVIDCGALRSQDRHLVREVFVAAWRRQCWGQQSMGFAQWNLLADMALAATDRGLQGLVFPGAIAVERRGERLILRC
ncbi:MAG: tRNA lysidine(34) synthetase TilS [Pirellulales bacterium]